MILAKTAISPIFRNFATVCKLGHLSVTNILGIRSLGHRLLDVPLGLKDGYA